MTPVPTRLRILRAMTTTLEQVHVDGTSLAGSVFRGRTIYGADTPLPSLSILEPPIPPETVAGAPDERHQHGRWELLVQGWTKDDSDNPTDPAHYLMAETKRVLTAEKTRRRGLDIFGMGDKVVSLDIGQGAVRPPDEISSRAYFWLLVTLGIVDDLANPYM